MQQRREIPVQGRGVSEPPIEKRLMGHAASFGLSLMSCCAMKKKQGHSDRYHEVTPIAEIHDCFFSNLDLTKAKPFTAMRNRRPRSALSRQEVDNKFRI